MFFHPQNIPISAGTKSLLVTTSALGAFSSAQWRHVLRMLTDVDAVDAQALSVASKLCQDLGHLGHWMEIWANPIENPMESGKIMENPMENPNQT